VKRRIEVALRRRAGGALDTLAGGCDSSGHMAPRRFSQDIMKTGIRDPHGRWRALLAGCVLLVPGLVAAAPAGTTAVESPGFTFVKSLGGIDEYRLDANGLQVLLKPDHSAPVATFNVTYRVGSRNEVTGTTGATHLLEHLMFKGSEHYNAQVANDVKIYLEKVGGEYNATTYTDRTHYFATLGKDGLEGYIAIEADRMRHLWLHESDRQAEMTVVRNEFERGKNDPNNLLEEEITAAAYQALPYHHSTIGWRSDIEHVPIEKLRAFYDTFYWPDNATVIVVGDIEPKTVLGYIAKYYGAYPKAPQPIPTIYTEEPEQTGPRRVIVKKPGELGSVSIAHKTASGLSPDQPALAVLDSILADGKSSRLYHALVDKGIALSARSQSSTFRDLNLHFTTASLAPGATHEQAEKALLEQLELVKSKGVTAEEVERARRKYSADRAYRLDGTMSVMWELNEWTATGDWTEFVRFPDAVDKVTPQDVQRVARTYLNEDQSTTGWFVPVAKDKAGATK
jgi:zinc protease